MADAQAEDQIPVKKSKLPLIIILVVVLLGGGGGGAYFAFARGGGGDGDGGGKAKSSRKRGKRASGRRGDKLGPSVTVPTFIVNLNEPGATRYLKLAIELEFDAPPSETDKRLQVRFRDQAIIYLSSLRVSDLQAAQSKKGLKKKLLRICDDVYGDGTVVAVYIRMLVMQ